MLALIILSMIAISSGIGMDGHPEGYYQCREQGNTSICRDLPMAPGEILMRTGTPKTL